MDICSYLDWDSNFFGISIARINQHHLMAPDAEEALKWAQSNSIECMYFLSDSNDPESTRTAEDFGFRLVDIRLTLEKKLEPLESLPVSDSKHVIRNGTLCDATALKEIAGQIHCDGRFHYDPLFGSDKANAFYEEWIENSLKGFADKVLIADVNGVPAGYVTCKMNNPAEGQIGLIGVGHNFQGHGIGRELLMGSIRWFLEQDAKVVMVVTQGRNCSAQRMYQKAGFVTREVGLWYHRWLNK